MEKNNCLALEQKNNESHLNLFHNNNVLKLSKKADIKNKSLNEIAIKALVELLVAIIKKKKN